MFETFGYTVPEQRGDLTDAGMINDAMARAVEKKLYKTVIPRINPKSGAPLWELDDYVRVPSDFELVLDNCTLIVRLGGGVAVVSQRGEMTENVIIRGQGRAQLIEENSYLPLIKICGTREVTLTHLRIKNSTAKAVLATDSTFFTVRDILFENTVTDEDCGAFDETMHVKNANGITLSGNMAHVTAENIRGVTKTHTIELNPHLGTGENSVIRDVKIRDVRSDCGVYTQVHVVATQGCKVSELFVEDVTDISPVGAPYRAAACVSIGDDLYGSPTYALGDVVNITVKNLITRANCAVMLVNTAENVTVADVTVLSDGGSAIGCDKKLNYHNLYLCNVKFAPKPAPYPLEYVKAPVYIRTPQRPGYDFYPYRAVLNMREIAGENFKINGIYADELDNLVRVTGHVAIEIYDVDVGEITYDDIVGDDVHINPFDEN